LSPAAPQGGVKSKMQALLEMKQQEAFFYGGLLGGCNTIQGEGRSQMLGKSLGIKMDEI